MVEVFKEVKRVLRRDGTAWVNMGDCYNSGTSAKRKASANVNHGYWENGGGMGDERVNVPGLQPKQLVGMPWRLAFALQSDGWWLRSDIIWHKPNPMPESVTDRPTKAHEYLFLLAKSQSYFFDAEAIKEACEPEAWHNSDFRRPRNGQIHPNIGTGERNARTPSRNKRDVWTIPSAPYSEAHFATFPPDLVKPCILAGTSARGCCPKCGSPWERMVERTFVGSYHDHKHDSDQYGLRQTGGGPRALDGRKSERDLPEYKPPQTLGWRPGCECGEDTTVPATVLDPFGGSGTTGMVALELGRNAILCELNPAYLQLARQRCCVTPGLCL